jgi:hypothetical protein
MRVWVLVVRVGISQDEMESVESFLLDLEGKQLAGQRAGQQLPLHFSRTAFRPNTSLSASWSLASALPK